MRVHGNARLTPHGRGELARRVLFESWSTSDAARAAAVLRTAGTERRTGGALHPDRVKRAPARCRTVSRTQHRRAPVTSALPAAQNLFTYASRYHVAERLARESILLSTLASVPALVVIAALLG